MPNCRRSCRTDAEVDLSRSSPRVPLILGIDPGIRVTGYGLLQVAGTRYQHLASGCIRTNGRDLAPRLEEIYQGLMQVIDLYQPSVAAIENIFVAKSAESALKLGHARAAAILAARSRRLPLHEYASRSVKKAVVGRGGATKEQVQRMVQRLLGLRAAPQADAADALAIALCHEQTASGLAQISGARAGRRGRMGWQPGAETGSRDI